MSLDEAEATFTRRVPPELTAVSTLKQVRGKLRNAERWQVPGRPSGGYGTLGLLFPGQPFQALIPWKASKFRVKEFSDLVFEFVVVDGEVKELKQSDPSGEYRFPRK